MDKSEVMKGVKVTTNVAKCGVPAGTNCILDGALGASGETAAAKVPNGGALFYKFDELTVK